MDLLVVFEEDTPLELIKALMPDILVKGGDYTIDQIVGAKDVIAGGGKVIINPTPKILKEYDQKVQDIKNKHQVC